MAPPFVRPPRVLLVTARYLPYVGGTEIQTHELAHRLAAEGYEVTILTTDPSGTLAELEHRANFTIRRVPAFPKNRDYYIAPRIYHEIVNGDWDLVHCQGVHTFVAPLAMFAARRASIPYLLAFHSGGHSSQWRNQIRGIQWQLLRPLIAGAKYLVAVSKYEATAFRTRLKLPAEKFVVIPGGSHLPITATTATHPSELHTIVSVGRLEKYKGHHRIIEALPMVLERYPNLRLQIIGTGPYEDELHRLTAEVGVAAHVEIGPIPGNNREAMAAALIDARLVILLSDYESQGMAVYEALAMGRPVLVAHTSALSELVQHGWAHSTSLDSTPSEVAAAMMKALDHPLIPPKIELPTWEAAFADYLQIYQKVLQPKFFTHTVEPSS
jgi:glycosyltransferase involved in cell wall biosynthesis